MTMTPAIFYTVQHIEGEDLSGRFQYWEKTTIERMTYSEAVSAVKEGIVPNGYSEQLDSKATEFAGLPSDGTIVLFCSNNKQLCTSESF